MNLKRFFTDLRQQLEVMTSPVVVGLPWLWGWFRFIAIILLLTAMILAAMLAALCALGAAVTLVTLDFHNAKAWVLKFGSMLVWAASPIIGLYVLGYRFPGHSGGTAVEPPDSYADDMIPHLQELARNHAAEDAALERKLASAGKVSLVDDVSEGGQLSPATEDGELSLPEKPPND